MASPVGQPQGRFLNHSNPQYIKSVGCQSSRFIEAKHVLFTSNIDTIAENVS